MYTIRPSHLPTIPSGADPSEYLENVNVKDMPIFYITLDGKPSDRYIEGGNYCLAILMANNPQIYHDAGERVKKHLKRNGLKFQKLSKVRGKNRKIRFINSILDCLIEISKAEKGLRFNTMISMISCELMNPKRIKNYFCRNSWVRKLYNVEIVDDIFIFDYNKEKIPIHLNDFAGMVWWHKNLLQVSSFLRTKEKNISWWVHFDRLPLDHSFKKTILFCSMMDYFFNHKLWMSFSDNEKMALDILPDFYANLYYNLKYNIGKYPDEILQKTQELYLLNSPEYWKQYDRT